MVVPAVPDGNDEQTPRRLPRRLLPVGLLSWAVFALAWWRVTDLHAQVGRPVLVDIVACALLVLAVDLWWVGHNRRIYRVKGPRRGRPPGGFDYSVERLGRPAELVPAAALAREVALEVSSSGAKTYRPVGR